jgi:hypothetical protein
MSGRALATLLCAALLLPPCVLAQPATAGGALLGQLAGSWDMTGTLLGKPIHQHGEGRWVLRDGWLCFTIVDLSVPPAYQAAVYLGFDAKAGDYVAHWLDQFGAAGARVVGSGHGDEHTLVLIFPYPEGAFRDTFVLEPGAQRGTLLLESQQADGHWSRFASYHLRRLKAAATAAPGR